MSGELPATDLSLALEDHGSELHDGERRSHVSLADEEHRPSITASRVDNTHPSVSLKIVHPKDNYNVIYCCLVLVGAGYLMPYNSFVTCVDYLQTNFPDEPVEFVLSFIYIVVSFISVFIANLTVKLVSTHTRILIGYVLSIGPLLYVTVVHLWLNILTTGGFALFSILVSCAIAGIGCSVQQSSFYGYSGMLPPRYVQAVMLGESFSGVIVSGNRILTKTFSSSLQFNTLVFFGVSSCMLMLCVCLHQFVRRSEFSKFYTGEPTCQYHASSTASQRTSRSESAFSTISGNEPTVTTIGSNANESRDERMMAYRVITGTVPSEIVGFGINSDDLNLLISDEDERSVAPNCGKGFQKRLRLAKIIWVYMLTIMNAYCCTLLIFPGFETEVKAVGDELESLQQKNFDPSWIPVVMVTLFNCCDFVGKIFSSSATVRTSPKLLLAGSFLRYALLPLFLICIYPSEDPIFPYLKLPVNLTIILGLTNGYFGSAPMIIAPQLVSEGIDREMVGNIMTLSYFVGLTLGASGAFYLKFLLRNC